MGSKGKQCAVPNKQPSGAWHKKRLEATICPVAKIKGYGLRTEESQSHDRPGSKTAKATSMRELVVKVKWPPNPMVLSRSTGASLTFGAAVLQDGKFIQMS